MKRRELMRREFIKASAAAAGGLVFAKLAEEKGLPKIDDGMLLKGPEAYHQMLAAPLDAVLITSPPYFHPEHFPVVVGALAARLATRNRSRPWPTHPGLRPRSR